MATEMDMLQRIKCTVDSCTFNTDRACTASSIEVNVNQMAAEKFKTEFAAELGKNDSHTSEFTMCRTYKPRNKG